MSTYEFEFDGEPYEVDAANDSEAAARISKIHAHLKKKKEQSSPPAIGAPDASGNVGTARAPMPLDKMGDGGPGRLELGLERAKDTLVVPWKNMGKLATGDDPYAPGEAPGDPIAISKRAGGILMDIAGGPMAFAGGGVKGGIKALLEGAAAAGVVGAAKVPEWAAKKNQELGDWVAEGKGGIVRPLAATALGTLLEAAPDLAANVAVASSLQRANSPKAKAAIEASAAEKLAAVEANLKQAPSPDEVLTALKQATGRSDLKKWTMGKDSVDVMEAGARPPSFDEMGVPAVTKKGAVLPREVVDRRQIQHLNDLLDLTAQEEPAATQPSAAEASALLEGRMPDEAPAPVPPPELQSSEARIKKTLGQIKELEDSANEMLALAQELPAGPKRSEVSNLWKELNQQALELRNSMQGIDASALWKELNQGEPVVNPVQVRQLAPKGAPKAQPLVAGQGGLPRELRGAKPRYRDASPTFLSDVDKALYIVAQKTPSKADAGYMAFLRKQLPQFKDADIRRLGEGVRTSMKSLYKNAENGVFEVPASDISLGLTRPKTVPQAPQNVPVRPLEPVQAVAEGLEGTQSPDTAPPEMLEAPVKPAPAAPEAQIQAPVKPAGSQAYSPTEASVSTPKGSKYPIKYKVVEADDLVTSHNPFTFSEDVRYPKGVQERDYLGDTAEQAKVIGNSTPGKFNPQRVLSDIDTAEAGPPIVTPGNIAMGGNGRGMMIKRVYESPNPGALREATLAKAKALGVEGADGMKKPVLVREMQAVPTEPQALAQLSRELNAEFTGGKGATAETVSAGRSLSPEGRSAIAAVLSDYDTIAEAMKSKANAAQVMDALVKDGIVNQSKISEFMEEGVMTERGAARLRDTLVGSVIDDHAVLSAMPDSAKQNLAKNVVPIAAIQAALGEWNVTPMLKDAAKLMSDARRSGMTVDEFLRQGDLLGAVTTDVPGVVAMAKLLGAKPTEFKKAMRLYASELPQDGGLGFMQKDFRTAFKDAFGVDAPETGAPLVDPTADAIKRIQNGEAGSVNPIGVIIGAVDKVRKAGEVAFAESRPAKLDFMPEGYTKGGAAAMGQLKGKPLDSKLMPKSVLPLNAVMPELFHIANSFERLKQGFTKDFSNYWESTLAAGGVDNAPFAGTTPEMAATKKAIRLISPEINTRLTNADAFFLAMDGKIPESVLPPKMQAAIPVARQIYLAVGKAIGVPQSYLIDKYITHVTDVPESLRQINADKLAMEHGTLDSDGYVVNDPYLKERVGAAGYSLDPNKAFRAYLRQATRKMFDEPLLERLDAYKKTIPNNPENAWKLKRLDYLTRTLKGGQGDAWTAWDMALKDMTPKVLESSFAKMDKTQMAQWLRDRGFGYMENLLPSMGTTKNIHRVLSKAVYTALLGQAWNTAFWNLMQGGNTAALTGYRNAAKGYAAFTADALMSRLDPTYKSKVGSLGKVKEIQNIADGASELSNSSDFTKMVERLNMAPQALTETINRGAAVFSGLQKAQKLVDAGVLPNDPQAMLQYASGIEAITQFEYGPVNTAPVFDVPVVQLAKVLGTYPQQQALFMRHLWTSPAQKKIMGVPAGVWRAALFMGIVYGTGKAAGLNVGEKVGIKEDREGNINPLTFIPGVGAASDVPGLSGLLGHAGVGRGEWAGTTPFIQGAKGLAGLGQPGLEGKKAPTQVRNLAELLAAGSAGIPLRALNQIGDLRRELQTGRALSPRKGLIPIPGLEIPVADFLNPNVPGPGRKNTYRIDPAESVAKYLSAQPEVQKKYQDKKRKNR